MIAVYRTHVGLTRSSNQDAVLCLPEKGIFAVADGMGGHNGGDVASQMTVETLPRLIQDRPDAEKLRKSIRIVNYMIFQRQLTEEKLSGMGTTLTLLCDHGGSVIMEHVGDSRAYRLRNGKLEQKSKDHSLVSDLIENGTMTPEEAAMSPYRHVITRALGTEPDIDVDVSEFDLLPGDRWLLCSDGLYGLVKDAEIESVMNRYPVEKAADILLQAALNNGGTDNVSLLIAEASV